MVAYKKISPRENEADFLKIERRDLPQSKNQKMASTYFFLVEPHIELTKKNIRRAAIFVY